jgi:hypothetical protein
MATCVSLLSAACQQRSDISAPEVARTRAALQNLPLSPSREIMFVIDGSSTMGGACTTRCDDHGQCDPVCEPTDAFEAQRSGLISAVQKIPLSGGFSIGVVLSAYGDASEDACVMWGANATGCASHVSAPNIDPTTHERKGAPRVILPLHAIRSAAVDGRPKPLKFGQHADGAGQGAARTGTEVMRPGVRAPSLRIDRA